MFNLQATKMGNILGLINFFEILSMFIWETDKVENHRWKKQVPKTAQNDVFSWVLRVAGIWPIYVKLFRDIPIGHISWVLMYIWQLNILTIFYGNFYMLHSQILGKSRLKMNFFSQNYSIMDNIKIIISSPQIESETNQKFLEENRPNTFVNRTY